MVQIQGTKPAAGVFIALINAQYWATLGRRVNNGERSDGIYRFAAIKFGLVELLTERSISSTLRDNACGALSV